MSEQSEFLKDLGSDQQKDVLEQPIEPIAQGEDSPEESEMKLKNRRERRLSEKLQAEREANIALNTRLQVMSETKKFQEETGAEDPIKAIRAIYGDDTPEKRQASDIMETTLRKIHESAVEKALAKFEEQRGAESKAEIEEGNRLDEILENVEESHGIDMSLESDRKGFLTLLEKVSPKDRDGNIIEFADPDTVAELYLSRRERSTNRAKELSDRSMARSGSSQPSKIEEDAMMRYLRENDII